MKSQSQSDRESDKERGRVRGRRKVTEREAWKRRVRVRVRGRGKVRQWENIKSTKSVFADQVIRHLFFIGRTHLSAPYQRRLSKEQQRRFHKT